jgi:hypothetical protein
MVVVVSDVANAASQHRPPTYKPDAQNKKKRATEGEDALFFARLALGLQAAIVSCHLFVRAWCSALLAMAGWG